MQNQPKEKHTFYKYKRGVKEYISKYKLVMDLVLTVKFDTFGNSDTFGRSRIVKYP